MSNDINIRIQVIDTRVSQLERINDEWTAKHGCPNEGIYNLIQTLMDERDELIRKRK